MTLYDRLTDTRRRGIGKVRWFVDDALPVGRAPSRSSPFAETHRGALVSTRTGRVDEPRRNPRKRRPRKRR